MKKISLFFLTCFVVMSSFAQVKTIEPSSRECSRTQNFTEKFLFSQTSSVYHLTERASTDRYETKRFFYDKNDRVIAIRDSAGDPTYGFLMVIDSVSYNDQNLVSRIDGYQFLNGTWKHVYYVNYSYDEAGNMVKRTNFNSFGSNSFTQGGVYDYFYENGRLVRHDMFFGDYYTIGERCFYEYDAQGRKVCERSLQGYGVLDSTLKINYIYDANGRLSNKRCYEYDMESFAWMPGEQEFFVYDENGNCVEHSVKNSAGAYSDRRFYEYHPTISSEDVSMPYYVPELMLPEAFEDANMRVLEHWYTLDVDYVLQYVCDYLYFYDGILMGVQDEEPMPVTIYPNPTENMLTVSVGQQSVRSLALFDVSGRLLYKDNWKGMESTMDLTTYPAGVYFLKITMENGKTAVQKILRR